MTEIQLMPKSPDLSLSLIASRRVRWTHQLARQEQLPTEDNTWQTWLYLAGRGAGKTRMAAEWLAYQASSYPLTRWAIVAPTYGDARDTYAEGNSGIVQILREYGTLKDYNRSIGEIFLTNGTGYRDWETDRKSTRLNSSHSAKSRMPSSA